MNLRKTRIPEQGTSNFTKTHTPFRSTPFIESIKTLPTTIPIKYHHAEPPIIKHFNPTINKQEESNPKLDALEQVSTVVPEIRKVFKGKGNIWRIAKSWKFAKKGYIEKEDLKNQMETSLRVNMSAEESEMIMKKYGNEEGKIDIQNFLSLIYGEKEYTSYKPILFDVKDIQKKREEKMNNLIDKLEFYEAPKRTNNALCEEQGNVKRMDSLKFEEKARKTLINCEKLSSLSSRNANYGEFAKEEFFRLTHDSFNKLKSAERHRNFHPENMANQNQTKARFNCSLASVKNSISNIEFNHPESPAPWDPCLEKTQKRLRQEARQQKIRLNAESQKENIVLMETKNMEKEDARLLRKRLDRESYDYSNFIKNSWL